MNGTELLTVDEVAAIVRVHPKTVRRWIAAGNLTAQRPGVRSTRVSRDELARFLAGSEVPAEQATVAVA